MKRLYVGNLPYQMTDAELNELFAAYGAVESAQVIVDRETGRSKGFGFVQMGNPAEADAATQALEHQRGLRPLQSRGLHQGRAYGPGLRRRRSGAAAAGAWPRRTQDRRKDAGGAG